MCILCSRHGVHTVLQHPATLKTKTLACNLILCGRDRDTHNVEAISSKERLKNTATVFVLNYGVCGTHTVERLMHTYSGILPYKGKLL